MNKTTRTLYRELLEKVSIAPLSQTLPLAFRLARELGDSQLENWVRLEMNGYYNDNPAMNENVKVPQYRFLAGFYVDIYGRPLVIQDPKLSFINTYPIRNGAEELEKMTTGSDTLVIQDMNSISFLYETFKVQVFSFKFSPIAVVGVLSDIRSELSDKLYALQMAHPEIEEREEKASVDQGNEQPPQVRISIGDGTTISGEFIVASTIAGSFNKANSADIPDDLKGLLKQLAQEVGKMSQCLPKESAKEVARDLESLTAEATSKNPRKKWWQLSAEGLTKAAKNVGKVGEPVLKLVGMILAILKASK